MSDFRNHTNILEGVMSLIGIGFSCEIIIEDVFNRENLAYGIK